jgi:hypothetical protein
MITLSDNTGRSFEDAIVISGAMNTEEGVAVEYEYLVEKFGIPNIDWFFIKQMLIPKSDKYFDKFLLKDNHDKEFEMYFDITDFFVIYKECYEI